MSDIFILGGHQSDFSINWHRNKHNIFDLFEQTVNQALESARVDTTDIEVGHVGNFVAPLFTGQAHLGGFFGHINNAWINLPAASHEAACASGSMALLGAMADIKAGFYESACVVGIEVMRNVPGNEAANNLRAAAWVDKEWQDTEFVWPCAFDNVLSAYQERYDLRKEHIAAISEKNYRNASNNPNAQSRNWSFNEANFSENEESNPSISGDIRRHDCGQITDGAAVVFLANENKAREYAQKQNMPLSSIPRIKGWGHINAPMLYNDKLNLSEKEGFLFPHLNKLFQQSLSSAGYKHVSDMDGLEVHDCFNITEYMILDHSGLLPAGQAWQAIENGVTEPDGELPINASGGLIGLGHPVGATGVRMLLDAYKQVSAQARDYQIEGAENILTFNLGGSATTCASFVVGR